MLRPIFAALLTGAALFGASAAQAGTHWSIGISLPPVGVVVADSPRYYAPAPTPVYYQPAPVYYEPPPVRYAPAPRYVERDVYYAPPPRVVYERRWDGRDDRWDHRGWDHDRRDHGDRRGHDRDDYGPRRGR